MLCIGYGGVYQRWICQTHLLNFIFKTFSHVKVKHNVENTNNKECISPNWPSSFINICTIGANVCHAIQGQCCSFIFISFTCFRVSIISCPSNVQYVYQLFAALCMWVMEHVRMERLTGVTKGAGLRAGSITGLWLDLFWRKLNFLHMHDPASLFTLSLWNYCGSVL